MIVVDLENISNHHCDAVSLSVKQKLKAHYIMGLWKIEL
jgi:hypothetical protein